MVRHLVKKARKLGIKQNCKKTMGMGVISIKLFFNRIYAIVLILAVCIGFGLLYQYQYFENTIRAEVETSIRLKMEYMASEMERHFDQSVSAIDSIDLFVKTVDDEENILFYLEEMLEKTPSYLSLYFGTPDNHMINGSGWIPPDTFDLRTRPWYIKATEEKKLITTSLYLNASKDNWIVTYAKPVYSQSGKFLGVVGGDNSLESVVSLLKDQKISENGFAFFLDAEGNLIMHSLVENVETDEENVQLITTQLDREIKEAGEGINHTILDGVDGVLAWNTIDETGWVVGNFAPISDFINIERQHKLITGSTIGLASITILLLFFLQRRYIVGPLVALNNDIRMISANRDISYRLPEEEQDTFVEIRGAVNSTLEQTQGFFESMIGNKLALEESERKNRAIVDVLPDLIFIYNPEGVFLDCMENHSDKLYVEREFFIGKRLHDVMPLDVAEKGLSAIREAIRTNRMQIFEYCLKMPDGTEYFETRLMKVTEGEVLAIVRNITESKEYLQKIEQLSFHDQLTGLYNRRFYEEELKRLDTVRNYPLTLVMLDVNGLKLTNDAFGHIAGDELLKAVAEVLKRQCRADDIIARIGGDEFIILLPETAYEEAESVVSRIQNDAQSLEIANIPISISAGWDTKVSELQPIMDTFVKAEDHMYRKKLSESQSMRNKTIQVILETLNAKNEREKIHSDNVSKIGMRIGESLGLNYETVKEVEIAGLMHDIGKIAINESLLNKPGALTEAEYVEIKKHPESGYQILKSVDAYSALAEYALSHHERWDGKGYPKGLKESEIPLISRIIAVADTFEAMTSDRAYRKAMSKEVAIEEMKRCSGTQFDPDVVAAFLRVYENGHE